MLAALLCPEKSTLTNFICTSGQQQSDFTAHYRLYSHDRVEEEVLFTHVRQQLEAALAPEAPLVVAMDDTICRKRGAKIDGVKWRRDPLGPPFQTNLVRSQRFLQFSAAYPLKEGAARMIPIGFFHAPGAAKPPRQSDPEKLRQHREEQKQHQLNEQTLEQIRRLRQQSSRRLILCGDGSYSNRKILRGLPENSVYIGRIRKDAKLHHLPGEPGSAPGAGRPARYGEQALTPEQLRTDELQPWEEVPAYAAGQRHLFRLKTLGPVLWRKSGANLPLRVIVIAPLGYRLRQGGKLLYRQPAYLLCTEAAMPLAAILQYYLWRWGSRSTSGRRSRCWARAKRRCARLGPTVICLR